MRARNIKPGFFDNEKLAELPALTRILYIGLWCYADREGRFEWRPKRIKANILPYDDCDIEEMLMSLHVMSFIDIYTTGNDRFGRIPKFREHQNPHPHEAKSRLPEPPENAEENQCDEMSLHVIKCHEMSPKCNADSLIPDIKNTPLPPKGGESEKPKRKRREKEPEPYSLEFEQAWIVYPRKDRKRPAFDAWKKAIKRGMPVADMPAHIESRMFEPDWRRESGRFIPHMATWLNADGWLDEGAKLSPHNMDEAPVFVDFYENTGGIVVPKPGEVCS